MKKFFTVLIATLYSCAPPMTAPIYPRELSQAELYNLNAPMAPMVPVYQQPKTCYSTNIGGIWSVQCY